MGRLNFSFKEVHKIRLAIGLVIAFSVVSIFGISLCFGALTPMNADCPLMQMGQSLCQKNLLTHAQEWFQLISVTRTPEQVLLLNLLLAVASFVILLTTQYWRQRQGFFVHNLPSPQLGWIPADYLQSFLSAGILHPKRFDA